MLCVHYSPTGDGIVSGHADGKIVRYMFQDEQSRVSAHSAMSVAIPACVPACSRVQCAVTLVLQLPWLGLVLPLWLLAVTEEWQCMDKMVINPSLPLPLFLSLSLSLSLSLFSCPHPLRCTIVHR